MAYDNTNRGSIWKNEKKRGDNDPDFTGSLNAGGVDYWVSAWKRKDGAAAKAPALSFSVKPKDKTIPAAKTDGKTVTARRSSAEIGRDKDDDFIPF